MLSAVIEYISVLLMTFMRSPSSDSSIIESEDIPQDWMQWVVLREGNNRKCLTPEHEGLCGFIDLIWLENCITHRKIIIKSCANSGCCSTLTSSALSDLRRLIEQLLTGRMGEKGLMKWVVQTVARLEEKIK